MSAKLTEIESILRAVGPFSLNRSAITFQATHRPGSPGNSGIKLYRIVTGYSTHHRAGMER